MQEDSSLFSMSIDPVTREHLSEAAKWARFLAIVGLIFLVLLIAVGIYSAVVIGQYETEYGGGRRGLGTAIGFGTTIGYFIIFLIYIFPIVFMLRFATKMRQALNNHDQEALNSSFQHLKVCFRYIGIVTVIFLVIMALSFLLALAGSAA